MYALWHSLHAQLFPAWAGVILYYRAGVEYAPAFPRMGGGDPVCLYLCEKTGLLSPHGRG